MSESVERPDQPQTIYGKATNLEGRSSPGTAVAQSGGWRNSLRGSAKNMNSMDGRTLKLLDVALCCRHVWASVQLGRLMTMLSRWALVGNDLASGDLKDQTTLEVWKTTSAVRTCRLCL